MIIYYGVRTPSNTLIEEPTPILRYFAKDGIRNRSFEKNMTDGAAPLSSCPSFTKLFTNTFAVRAVSDFKLLFSEKDEVVNIMPDEWSARAYMQNEIPIRLRDANNRLFSITSPQVLFLPEKSVNMTQLPAIYSNSDVAKFTQLAAGSFDPYKHPRPLDVAVYAYDILSELDVKVGDDLYYVKFDTNERIEFKPFFFNDDLNRMINDRLSAGKRWTRNITPLDKWYSFGKGHAEILINYIKKQGLVQ